MSSVHENIHINQEIVFSGSVKTTSSVAFISQRNELGCVPLYHYNYVELYVKFKETITASPV